MAIFAKSEKMQSSGFEPGQTEPYRANWPSGSMRALNGIYLW